MLDRVTVFAPATVANVGSAFDVLGFALHSPGDTVSAWRSPSAGVFLEGVDGDGGRLPREAHNNTAAVAAQAVLTHLRSRWPERYDSFGVSLNLNKGLPIGSGLGSSSASAAAGAFALNLLAGSPLSRTELIPFAMEGERVACGAAHADNVAPCLLGGFVLVRSYDPLDIIPLPCPPSAWVIVVTPHIEVRTEDARKILKRSVPLASAISQWGNVAALVAGIFQNDIPLMGRALKDGIIEPERSHLIPEFYRARDAALSRGAHGFSISGSGPSVFALASSQSDTQPIAAAITDVFQSCGIECSIHISRVDQEGAREVSGL